MNTESLIELLKGFYLTRRKDRILKRTPDPITETIDATAEQHLKQASKLETAKDAVFLNNLHRIGQDELETVRRYREKQVFGHDPGPLTAEEDMGDLIVCDDYHVDNRNGSPLLPIILSLGILGLGGYLAYRAIQPPVTPAPVAPVIVPQPSPPYTDTDTDTRTTLQFAEPINP